MSEPQRCALHGFCLHTDADPAVTPYADGGVIQLGQAVRHGTNARGLPAVAHEECAVEVERFVGQVAAAAHALFRAAQRAVVVMEQQIREDPRAQAFIVAAHAGLLGVRR